MGLVPPRPSRVIVTCEGQEPIEVHWRSKHGRLRAEPLSYALLRAARKLFPGRPQHTLRICNLVIAADGMSFSAEVAHLRFINGGAVLGLIAGRIHREGS